MTRDEILNMPAGREMDYLVAEMVMKIRPRIASTEYIGKEVVGRKYDAVINHEIIELPFYSTDISAAWEVILEMRENGFGCDMDVGSKGWGCRFGVGGEIVTAESMPLAICRAALLPAGQ
jgi:hypothetical protein